MNASFFRLFAGRALLVAAAVSAGACSDEGVAPLVLSPTDSVTVNAAAAYAYLDLATPARLVTVADPATSSGWDMGFFATTVTLNGGAAGPGGVDGYCVCRNEGASNAELAAMTPASQVAAFDSVTANDIPPAASFRSDALAPAISGWYTGTPGAGTVAAASGKSWIIREGTSSVVLAKFHVTAIQGASASSPGQLTFEYAVQPSAGAAFGAVQSRTLDVSAGPVFFDLTSGVVTSSADWDLKFDGYAIRVNGGVSGTGSVKAVVDSTAAFSAIDAAYASTVPAQAFRADAFSGVFSLHPWYRYNITGTDNQIWPTYNVYLVRRGTEVFKVQLTGYYDATGAPRQITLRYARLRD